MKKSAVLLILFWVIHLLTFALEVNFFPFLQYDLFARPQNFKNQAEVFYASTISSNNFSKDVSQEISFGPYWRFVVIVRRILREDPERLKVSLRKRIEEINAHRSDKIQALKFVEFDQAGKPNALIEVSL